MTGDGGPAIQAQFRVAGALAVDSAGTLYISDYTHIRRVGPDGIITTVAGNGHTDYEGDGGPATNAGFNGTYYGPALAVDPAGNLYLADTRKAFDQMQVLAGSHEVRLVSEVGRIDYERLALPMPSRRSPATHTIPLVKAGPPFPP